MERIGRYQIIREIGRGSMSIVYEAFDERIDRHLAIKVLRQHLARDVSSRQRFLREARAAGRLGHPKIVTVFDVGRSDGTPYIVMELIPGTTLADHLHQKNHINLPVLSIIDIAMQLCEALDYAHKQGVIHRDIKPANIHYDAETGRIKLMDFGIAAIEDYGRSGSNEKHISGTPYYMSPEQINGTEATRSSDMYAVGIVLFQLLSGQLPFTGNTVAEVISAITNRRMQTLKAADPDTPRALINLVNRLTSHTPASRPQNASQVMEELSDIQKGMKRGFLQNVRQHTFVWWRTAAIGICLCAVLLIGLGYIHSSQTEAVTKATYGYGDALASIIAQETAEPLILEDTTALSLIVADFSVNPEIKFLHITNGDGLVMASTDPFMRGRQKTIETGEVISRVSDSIRLKETESGHLIFQVPVRFRSQRVGGVFLGVDGSALNDTANATLTMLAVLFMLTALTALLGLWWLTRRQHQSVARLSWALKRLASGQYDIRIETHERHEFTDAHRQFNRLAIALDEHTRTQPTDYPEARSIESGNLPSASPHASADETIDLNEIDIGLDIDQQEDQPDSVSLKNNVRKITSIRDRRKVQ